MTETQNYTERFRSYFDQEVAQRAAQSLSNGVEIEFEISTLPQSEKFTFTKTSGKNEVRPGSAKNPQLVFRMPVKAADEVLSSGGADIGSIGVQVAKLIVAHEANRKISMQLKAGFFTLFSNGYFGVLKSGGAAFGSFLASRGLNGLDGVKTLIKKLKG